MGRKRIIILQTSHISIDQRMLKMSNSLSQDFEIEILCRNYLKNNAQINPSIYIDNVRCNYLNTLFKSGVFFYLEFNLLLFFKSIFKSFDIIYSVDSDTLLASTLLKILRKKNLIFDAHEYFEEVPELENKPIKKFIWNKITKFGLRYSNLNITVSNSLKKEFDNKFKKQFDVVRNIPDYSEQYNSETKFKNPTIIYQGALNKGRHIELLIKTMLELPQFDCLIIGEGDLTHELKKLSKNSPNIKFLGLLSPFELKKITPQCHLGFNMLEPIGKSYEMSLSNKYFDYLHAGIPSISSPFIEYQTLNSEYQIGICLNENELKECLISLLNFDDQYNFMLENIKKYKSLLTWKNEIEKIKPKILELVN